MKYICTEQEGGLVEIFIFPLMVDHDVMAESLRFMKTSTRGDWDRVIRNPVSAGFVDRNGRCHGESISLGITSRPEDTDLLAAQTYG